MLVLSSPSGAGKTTLSRMLLTSERGIELSISVTTRPRRRGEVNGRHYHFIDRKKFDQLVRAGDLLEYAEVFGNCYGTPRKPVEQRAQAGPGRAVRHRLAGHAAIARARPRRSRQRVLAAAVERRAGAAAAHPRAQDDKKVIRARMAKSGDEMSHWPEYDYVVVNRDLDRAFGDVRAILHAERLKRERQTGLSAFVRGLQSKL